MRPCNRIARCVAIGIAIAMIAVVLVQPLWAATPKHRDLVVLEHERWLDTLKGTVKNFGKRPARDVTVVVTFLDKRKKSLGTQRVSVGDLRSGDQSSWSLAISEKHRAAAHYRFETHALWD